MSEYPHDRLALAMRVAIRHHDGQTYGAGTSEERPYLLHCIEVAAAAVDMLRMTELPFSAEDVCVVGLLHDVIEDSKLGREVAERHVRAAAGDDNGDDVVRVTDVEAPNRRERKRLTLPVIATSAKATLVKVADRFVNQRASIVAGDVRPCRMYLGEYEAFREALHPVVPHDGLWSWLDAQQVQMQAVVDHADERRPAI